MLDNVENTDLDRTKKLCATCGMVLRLSRFAVNTAYPKGDDVCKYCRSIDPITAKGIVRALRIRGNKLINSADKRSHAYAQGHAYLNAATYVESKLVELPNRRKSK